MKTALLFGPRGCPGPGQAVVAVARRHIPPRLPALFLPILFSLTSCTVGPDYETPVTKLPAAYKNAGLDQTPPVGAPYRAFSDPDLNRLLDLARSNNQDLAQALARVDQARALLGLSSADLYPALTGEASADRNRDSANQIFPGSSDIYAQYDLRLNLAYEIDLWGRIRRSVRQAGANYQATAADFNAALLSIQGEVARDYLTLRALDREIALLRNTEALRNKRLSLVETRLREGDASLLDTTRATTELETVRSDIARLEKRRGELENALAVLTGRLPAAFKLPPESVSAATPSIPSGIPADLLRRRPEVLAAERRLAAANEEIGIAIATYLPRLSLTGNGGYTSLNAEQLFDRSSGFFSLGPSLGIPIFQGGRIGDDKARANAEYDEALAAYHQALLIAVRDVENALLATRTLDRALSAQKSATAAATRTAELSRARLEGGLDSLFEVIETERETLQQQRLLAQTRLDRQLATVQLIQALGGTWR